MFLPTTTFAVPAVVRAFQDAGALTAATAQPLANLPPVDMAAFARLLDAGVVREGAPGTFYLYPQSGRLAGRRRWTTSIFFWIVVILIPVLFLQLSAGRR